MVDLCLFPAQALCVAGVATEEREAGAQLPSPAAGCRQRVLRRAGPGRGAAGAQGSERLPGPPREPAPAPSPPGSRKQPAVAAGAARFAGPAGELPLPGQPRLPPRGRLVAMLSCEGNEVGAAEPAWCRHRWAPREQDYKMRFSLLGISD